MLDKEDEVEGVFKLMETLKDIPGTITIPLSTGHKFVFSKKSPEPEKSLPSVLPEAMSEPHLTDSSAYPPGDPTLDAT